MELLIALGIIIAISELKEWRFHKRHKEFECSFNALKENILSLNKKIELLDINNSSEIKSLQKEINDNILNQLNYVQEIKSLSENLLKELEINGVVVKKLEGVDYIEGL